MLEFIKKIILYLIHIIKCLLRKLKGFFKASSINSAPKEKNPQITAKKETMLYNSSSTNIDTDHNKKNSHNQTLEISESTPLQEIDPTIKVITISDKLIDYYIKKEINEEIIEQKKGIPLSINKLKEEIKPIIKEKINQENIKNTQSLKKEIKKVVKEKIQSLSIKTKETSQTKSQAKPQISPTPPKKETPIPYVIATSMPPKLTINPQQKPTITSKKKTITTTKLKKGIRKRAEDQTITMIPLVKKDNLKVKPKDTLTNALNVSIALGTNVADKLIKGNSKPQNPPSITPSPKQKSSQKPKHDPSTTPPSQAKDIEHHPLPSKKEVTQKSEPQIVHKPDQQTPKKELESAKKDEEILAQKFQEELKKELAKPSPNPPDTKNDSKKPPENKPITNENEPTPEQTKDLKIAKELIIPSTIILEKATLTTINETNNEMKSAKGVEEKAYDKYEAKIDKLLNDIENYEIKYTKSLTEEQKKVLNQQKDKLRKAKDNIQIQYQNDLDDEKKEYSKKISDDELNGLQNYLKSLHLEQELEFNNNLLNQMNNLQQITQEQIANIDKKILMKNLKKASLLAEMTSIIAFPFIRSKYFFYFTAGLIIDNHFNFINAFFKRKMNKFQPPNLSALRQGKDALDKAIDQTYDNIEKLQYITYDALNRYPELSYDKKFNKYVNKLNNNLQKNYEKLVKKREIIDKYYNKTNKQVKKLQKKKPSFF